MRAPFGRHLYNQIAVPLVLASLVVGLVATGVAVYVLSNLTEEWVDSVAEGAAVNVENRVAAVTADLMVHARLAAADDELKVALAQGNLSTVGGILAHDNVILEVDDTILLDESGVVVSASGSSDIIPGDVLLDENQRTYSQVNMAHPLIIRIDDTLALAALQPIATENQVYTMAVVRHIDDEFLALVTAGAGDAFCFYDAQGEHVACTADLGANLPQAAREELQAALHEQDSAIAKSVAEAKSNPSGIAATRIELNDTEYRAWAKEFDLEGDPLDTPAGYVVSVVNQSVTDATGRTTTQLIVMWSIVAVLALVGLGVWIARRVSAPLAELSEGAERIADGDFSTKIEVTGSNEIADLADSFNQMTDSLKERSESLTKKVLELATLYEMSRALGATLEMNALLEGVLDSALRIFNLELGYVAVRNKDTDQLDLVAWRAPGGEEPDEFALGNSMSEWVVREGRPLIFNPTETPGEDRVDAVSGALASLCVPLMTPEGSVGAISVGCDDPEFRFNSDDVRLLSTIANHVTMAIGNIELFSSLQDAYLATVRSLAAAVDAKDAFTRGHSDKVAAYAVMIGEELGLSHEQRIALEMAAYLHDIGKIGIKEEILLKPGKLTDDEMAQMSHHPLIGANILKPVGFPWPITPVVRHHHERWDGGGYPAGLKGEEIPLLARVLTVADAFEAMTADRPYRGAITYEEGLAELMRCSGSQFDERVVMAFSEVMAKSPHFEENIDTDEFEDIDPAEARAIFVAIAEGMLSSFRKLGGPRLAANVETELNEACHREGIPLSISSGRVVSRLDEIEDRDLQLTLMRQTLGVFDVTMGRMSGNTLVDHFYTDALATLSERMQGLAEVLDFHSSRRSGVER